MGAEGHNRLAIEYSLGASHREILARSAARLLAHPSGTIIPVMSVPKVLPLGSRLNAMGVLDFQYPDSSFQNSEVVERP